MHTRTGNLTRGKPEVKSWRAVGTRPPKGRSHAAEFTSVKFSTEVLEAEKLPTLGTLATAATPA